jgi:predicted nucleotidyltransferase
MIPEVRKKLLQIGNDFYDFCKIEWVDMDDIILTGSLANFNWSQYSDVDLHVVVNYEGISNNADLAEDFGWTKKELWNSKHDIFIKTYPIELYLQNSEDELVAGGVYSVLYDKWIRFPEKLDVQMDASLIQKYINFFDGKVKGLQRRFSMGDYNGLLDEINAIKKLIAGMRKKGLQGRGEFSSENIAFKSLRRMGALDILDGLKAEVYDSSNSYGHEEPPKPKAAPVEVQKEPKEDKSIVAGQGRYFILGKRYTSLRQAEKKLGIPKSTLQYRVKSDSAEFSQYTELNT